jgi:hypothetical protein
MAQKPMLRAEVYARALRVSQNVKPAEVWLAPDDRKSETVLSARSSATLV